MSQGIQIAGVPMKQVDLDNSVKAFHIKDWGRLSEPKRMAMLRQIAQEGGRDPRIATLAVQIVRAKGVQPRDYERQASAILTWVQDNIYYANEPGERLQDPIYTLRVRYGDCDDMAIILAALYESLRLPWRFVLSGKNSVGQVDRWIEGTPIKRLEFSHIYVVVGWPPFTPKRWSYAEPTLKGAALGWDVVRHTRAQGKSVLPELAGIGDVAGTAMDVAGTAIEKIKEALPFEPEEMDLSPATIAADVKKAFTPRRIVAGLIISGIFAATIGRLKKGKK